MTELPILYDKLNDARRNQNVDAVKAFRCAIEATDKGDASSAAWWERQGDLCVSEVLETVQ